MCRGKLPIRRPFSERHSGQSRRRSVVIVPTPDGQTNPLVPFAAAVAGWIGFYHRGAQAVAALAYGTPDFMPAVDKIVGLATSCSDG